MKILATTLGKHRDFLSMTLNLGYIISLSITTAFFFCACSYYAEVPKILFPPLWGVIVGTTSVGTEISDLIDRTLGLGYMKGSFTFFPFYRCPLLSWYFNEKNLELSHIEKIKEAFY